MSVGEFYHDHFRDVFNDQLIELMNDSTKIWAVYDNNSIFPERDSCMKIKAADNNLAEVFVSVRGGDLEGLSVLIYFVKSDSSFKFYGLSTIP